MSSIRVPGLQCQTPKVAMTNINICIFLALLEFRPLQWWSQAALHGQSTCQRCYPGCWTSSEGCETQEAGGWTLHHPHPHLKCCGGGEKSLEPQAQGIWASGWWAGKREKSKVQGEQGADPSLQQRLEEAWLLDLRRGYEHRVTLLLGLLMKTEIMVAKKRLL